MRQLSKAFRESRQCGNVAAAGSKRFRSMCGWLAFVVGLATFAAPAISVAESQVGAGVGKASVDFRIIIPAIIRVTPVSQPDHLVIEERHVAQGYIDLDAGTSVRLTINTRDGYLLTARYDAQLLSSLEVRISSQNLTASSGAGSMRVASGLSIDKLVPVSYRLNLAPGVRAGEYRWPVALAFALAAA